jgi:ATP-dependent Lhr-like helicase
VLSHEILNARPYAFLDDAPLEERRTQAVYARRASEPASAGDLGALDAAAIDRVRDEERPEPRDADELHDALLTTGFLTEAEAAAIPSELFERLVTTRRAGLAALKGCATADTESTAPARSAEAAVAQPFRAAIWVSAERLPEWLAVHPSAAVEPPLAPPPARASRVWTREEAIVELLRGRLTLAGPTTAPALAGSLLINDAEADAALQALESEGAVLRGVFTPAPFPAGGEDSHLLEWCDRRLLARIHRYTLNRLRAEIEPVSPADFMRFLFAWQQVDPSSRLSGIDGLHAIIGRLDGFELAAGAWERSVLPARMDRYDPAMLDMLCLTGQVGWGRLSAGPAPLLRATPIALFLREHAVAWQTLRTNTDTALHDAARRVLEALRARGASFFHELAAACELDDETLRAAIGELVAAGLVASDGFAGLRAILRAKGRDSRASSAGRWWALQAPDPDHGADAAREAAVEAQAWSLLRRYGIVFRRLLAREANAAPWRELTRVYRRLEARGEIRGGRFVSGMSGEQFALGEAVDRLREARRSRPDGRLIAISTADPLNLAGIVTAGDRVRAAGTNRIVYRDGVPLAVMEGDYVRQLAPVDPDIAADVATALAGRPVPPVLSGFVGRVG